MSTKLTGIDDMGLPTTAGDSGTLVTDGSLILGNSDTDSVTFNADIASNLIPDAPNLYSVGSTSKPWRGLIIDEGVIFKSQISTGYITMGFTDPVKGNHNITVPNADGTLALEGFLPSYLTFGKNFSQSAPVNDYELTTVNGSTNARGWRMPVPGEVTHISCQFDATVTGNTNSMTITLWLNGVKQVGYDLVLTNVASGDVGASLGYSTPLPFAANDQLTLKLSMTKGPNDTFAMDDLNCLLRILN